MATQAGLDRVAAINATIAKQGQGAPNPMGGGGAVTLQNQGSANPADRYSASAVPGEKTNAELANPGKPLTPQNNPNSIDPMSTVNTGQPSPTTVNATPYTSQTPNTTNAMPDQVKAVADATSAVNDIKSKYTAGLATAKTTGQAPTTQGQANATIQQSLPGTQAEPPSIVGQVQDMDSSFDKIFTDYDEHFSPANQRKTLVEEYQQMSQSLGIDKLNTDILNTKRIIEGTEDDIRSEITAVGGMGTESQVLALSNARNKSLMKNYQALLDTRDSAQTQLTTLMQLSTQDRQAADAEFDRKLNFAFKVQDFKQKAVDNAKEAYNTVVSKVGYAGLLQSTNGDPYQQGLIEKTLGLASGGLQKLASQPDLSQEKLQLEIQGQKLQNQKLTQEIKEGPSVDTQVVDVNGKKLLVNSKTGETIKEIGGGATTTGPLQLAQAKGNIDLAKNILDNSYLSGAVGPNKFSRLSPTSFFTSGKGNVVSDIKQLTSQLTIDKLNQAKAQGATFGALQQKELELLADAATKINNWAVTDTGKPDGKIIGYETSENEFKKEVDKINNFAKLDYLLKGGSVDDIGAKTLPDGTIWVQNSDGSMTQLK